MSQYKKSLKPLTLAIGATFIAGMATSPLATAATGNGNPFAMNDLHSSYSQVADMKCGSSMNNASTKTKTAGKLVGKNAKSSTEGKCGSNKTKTVTKGKCGASK